MPLSLRGPSAALRVPSLDTFGTLQASGITPGATFSERAAELCVPPAGIHATATRIGAAATGLTGSIAHLQRIASLALSAFGDDGSLVLAQEFGASPKLTIIEGGKRTEIERSSSKCVVVQKGLKGKPKETVVDLGATALETPEAFVKTFVDLYGPVLKLDSVRAQVGTFKIAYAEFERHDDVLRVSSLLGNGGGDELVVIEEPGKHFGRVFCNMQDEGLYSVESLDEFVEEELESCIGEDEDVDVVAADKVRLVECLPFFENPIAKDLGELFAKIQVAPKTDHRKRLEALAPAK